jgi:hypothetical protein
MYGMGSHSRVCRNRMCSSICEYVTHVGRGNSALVVVAHNVYLCVQIWEELTAQQRQAKD